MEKAKNEQMNLAKNENKSTKILRDQFIHEKKILTEEARSAYFWKANGKTYENTRREIIKEACELIEEKTVFFKKQLDEATNV